MKTKQMKTTELTINLGLNNNPHQAPVLLMYMRKYIFKSSKDTIKKGVWNGQIERTIIIKGKTELTPFQIRNKIDYLNNLCTQDCISYKINDLGFLQYNKTFKGDKYKFDNKYFLTL